MLLRIYFTVDGSPVDLSDWSFSSSSDLGFDQFRANATNARARKIVGGIEQGSIVEAFTETGMRVWQGTVPQAPKLNQNGVAQVAAQGYAYRATKSGNRVSPIIDSPGAWIPANLDPVNYPLTCGLTSFTITNTLASRKINFLPDGAGDEFGWAFFARGMNITRFSATLDAPGSGIVWRLLTARLPDTYATRRLEAVSTGAGAMAQKGTGSPRHGYRHIFASAEFQPSDVVIIELFHTTGGVVGASLRNITDPKVWGDYDADVVYTDQAARIVARQLGWDFSGVTGRGAAPLTASDWVGDGASYMSYIAGLEDFCWGVWDDQGYGPLLTYGPYGRKTWEVSAATGATWDLDPLERIRRVTVQFNNVDNSLGEVSLEAPESAGLPDDVATELKGALIDNQSEQALAAVTAWRLLQRFLSSRYRGRVNLIHAFEEGSRRDAPYEVRGGDLLKITDFSLDGSITLRVHDVEYGPNGVTVGIEAPALPLGGSLRGGGIAIRPGAAPLTTVTGGTAVYAPPGNLPGGPPGGFKPGGSGLG
jgi:hypothetical protein